MSVIIKLKDVKNLKSSIGYLRRREEVCTRVCSSDMTDREFILFYKNGKNQGLIISPERECDLTLLLQKTIKYIERAMRVHSLAYLAYIHKDTDHSHIHVIIPKKKSKNYDLSEHFIKDYLRPYLMREVQKECGKRSESEEKEYYIESVKKDSVCIVDYDIKRLCLLDKSKKFLIYSKEKENKVEGWKLPYIQKRTEMLIERGYGTHREGYTIFFRDFILKMIRKRRLREHGDLSGIDEKEVIYKFLKKEDRGEIINKIEKKYNVSYLVKGKDDNIYLFEEKKRGRNER